MSGTLFVTSMTVLTLALVSAVLVMLVSLEVYVLVVFVFVSVTCVSLIFRCLDGDTSRSFVVCFCFLCGGLAP